MVEWLNNGSNYFYSARMSVDKKFFETVLKDTPSVCHYCKRQIQQGEMCFAQGARNKEPPRMWCADCNEKANK